MFNAGPGPNNIATGGVWKIDPSTDTWKDITPVAGARGGYGGLALDPEHPGTLLVSSIDRWPDEIYRTTTGDLPWTALGPTAVRDVAGAQWLYWHGNSPTSTGWMGSIQIDPFRAARALYVTGQGLWWSDDITSADTNAPTHWAFQDNGLEQTVPLGLLSPPAGAHLLSAMGDICGFRHDDFDASPPDGMFSNPIFGNTSSFDFAESRPALIVRVGTNSSSASTPTTGAYSTDGGTNWVAFPSRPGGTASAGSVAVSSDGATFLWAPQASFGGDAGAGSTPSYSRDWAKTWTACSGLPAGARVAADRVNPNKFYARAGSSLYVSIDGGATFSAPAADSGVTLPRGGLVRPVFGREGDVWLSGGGLFHSTDSGATITQITTVASANAVGFGLGANCSAYPVVYVAGTVLVPGASAAVPGVFRSDDKGMTWQRIDDLQHQFGTVSYVSGDPRAYGRVYLGTGGRGVVFGDPR